MDDQMNQGMPGSVPPSPMGGGIPPVPPLPPSEGGIMGEDPHEKILAALARIEEKLASVAVKVGV